MLGSVESPRRPGGLLGPARRRRACVSNFACSWRLAGAVATLVLPGCQEEARPPQSGFSETAVVCDSLLASVEPVGSSVYHTPAWEPALVIGPVSGPPIEAIVGIRWHAGLRRLVVADAIARRVQIYGPAGEYLYGFGREGEGPGEFSLTMGHWLRNGNALALFGPDSVLVHTEGLVHIFAMDGTFGRRLRVSARRLDPLYDRHMDPWVSGGILFDATAAGDRRVNDPAVWGDLPIHALLPGDRSPRPERVAAVRNPQSLHSPAPEGGPSPGRTFLRPGPMDGILGRMWTAVPGGAIALLSLHHQGVCFKRQDGEGLVAYAVEAPRIPVTHRDRSRFFDERRSQYGPTVPMVGGTWDNYYHEFPDHYPPSVDVVFADRATVWVSRYSGPDNRAWDIYDLDEGYVGTLEPFADRLPMTFAEGCGLVVEEPDPNADDFAQSERVRVWCPAGRGWVR